MSRGCSTRARLLFQGREIERGEGERETGSLLKWKKIAGEDKGEAGWGKDGYVDWKSPYCVAGARSPMITRGCCVALSKARTRGCLPAFVVKGSCHCMADGFSEYVMFWNFHLRSSSSGQHRKQLQIQIRIHTVGSHSQVNVSNERSVPWIRMIQWLDWVCVFLNP